MNVVIGILQVLTALAVGLIFILVVAWAARRALGTPIGWLRTIFVSTVAVTVMAPLIGYMMLRFDMVDTNLNLLVDPIGLTLWLMVAVAWIFALAVGALVLSEVLVPTWSVPQPWAVFGELRRQGRINRRLRTITLIAVRNGLGGFLGRRTPDQPTSAVARALTRTLNQSGVTFIKVGQLAATRPDLISEEFATALARLQTHADTEEWSLIRAAVEDAWGVPIENHLAWIDPTPLAAASVAQVHRATLHDGTAVVLKVQRPAARAQVTADLEVLRRISGSLERRTAWGAELRVGRLAEGFAESLAEELDYCIELANMTAVRSASDLVVVPRPHPQLCTPTVMVADEIVGAPLSNASEQLAAMDPAERGRLARVLVREVLDQVLLRGTFHADLHPGNVILRSPDAGGGLAMLDFGSVGRLDRHSRDCIVLLLYAVDNDDALAAADVLITLLGRPAGLDDRELEAQLGQTMAKLESGVNTSGLFGELFAVMRRSGFTVPPNIAAAFRTLVALDGTLKQLDPTCDLVGIAREETRDLAAQFFNPEKVRTRIQQQLAMATLPLQRLPRQLFKLSEDLSSGRFSMQLRPFEDPQGRGFLVGMANKVIQAFLAGALAVASVVLIVAPGGPQIGTGFALYPLFGAAILLVAFMLGLRVLVSALAEAPPRMARGKPAE